MKRLLLPVLIAFFGVFCFPALAQPTLTAANTNVVVGEQYLSYWFNANVNHFNTALPAGPNVSWNFANLVSPASNLVQIQFQPPVVIGANAFPLSNAVIRIDDKFEYLTTSSDSVMVVGLFDNFAENTFTYNNPVKKLQYPFTFNQTFTDSYGGYLHGPFPTGVFTGSVQVKADGYGTLIIPTGTFPNVLRIKTLNIRNGFNAFTSYIDSVTTYEWYLPGFHIPILKIKKDKYAAPNFTGTEYEAFFLNPNAVGLSENESFGLTFKTFPNPATSEVTIQYQLKALSNVRLSVSDALGREALRSDQGKQPAGSKTKTLDVSKLPKGVYLVRLETEVGMATKRLLIQ